MKAAGCLFFSFLLFSCSRSIYLPTPTAGNSPLTGSAFYKFTASYNWKQRDSLVILEVLSGNLPSLFRQLIPVHVSVIDSVSGNEIRATYYVSPDYVSVGTNVDWVRVPITPMAGQRIADSFDCFLPTRKMVDDIYKAATVKLEPVPMYAYRDSSPTMYQHHLIIEGQRRGRSGLIAGIKKDVVTTNKITKEIRSDRVAIYGWHKMDGKPILPLYTGHVGWYVDYSHAIRLVHRKMKVEGEWMDYLDVLSNPVYRRLLSDE